MTQEEFLSLLSSYPCKVVLEGEKIRIYEGEFTLCYCPITYVCHKQGHSFNPENWQEAAVELKLPLPLAWNIVDASDIPISTLYSYHTQLRHQLFEALSLLTPHLTEC